jgi:hypothetical protein
MYPKGIVPEKDEAVKRNLERRSQTVIAASTLYPAIRPVPLWGILALVPFDEHLSRLDKGL